MKRYRAEIFDKDYNFYGGYSIANDQTLINDYCVLDQSTITIPKKVIVTRGNYVLVKDTSSVIYQGIVTDYSYSEKQTAITMQPLMEILDTSWIMDASLLDSMSIEAWMDKYIKEIFNGADTYQNLTGLTVTHSTATSGSIETVASDSIYNLYDLALQFFRVYGLVFDFNLDISKKKFEISMRLIDGNSVWKLETDLADVVDYSITAANSTDKPNKITYVDTADSTNRLTYYWHETDFAGTIDTDLTTNRSVPVYSTVKTATATADQTFAQVAYADAYQSMYRDRYSDLIEIKYKSDSRVVDVGKIGQLYQIIDGDFKYNTVLTAYQRLNDKQCQLTFGLVRLKLTQILKLDRRK